MKILIAGDFRPVLSVAECFEKNEFQTVLGEVRQVIDKVDYSIVNLESPVVEHEAKPIVKNGPNLKCSIKGLEALKWAGFDCVTLANNHFLDYGATGVRDTLDGLNSLNIDSVGGGMNLSEASKILYKKIGEKTLAVINCCEHEFSVATEATPGSNPLNPIRQFNDIQEARQNADKVMVIVHGGHEHFQLPSPRMVETYRFFIDAGADAVVNHHQHCFSGYEVYQGKPVFYGLGNFCYEDKGVKDAPWNDGYMAVISFEQNSVNFEIVPYKQCNGNPTIKVLESSAFDKQLQTLNEIISDKDKLIEKVHEYYHESMETMENIFEPIQNRFYLSAKHRGYLPSLINKKHIIIAKNIISCEAHHDKLVYWLRDILPQSL